MTSYDEDDVREARGLSWGHDRWGVRPSNGDHVWKSREDLEREAVPEVLAEDPKTVQLGCPNCGARETDADLQYGHKCGETIPVKTAIARVVGGVRRALRRKPK